MAKYYFYHIDFDLKDNLGNDYLVRGHTVASSEKDAKRRIKTMYHVIRFGKIIKSANQFDKPLTKGIA